MCYCYYVLMRDLYDSGFNSLVYVASKYPLCLKTD